MRKRTEIAIWGTVVVASLGLHAVAFGGLGGARTDGFGKPKMKPATFVDDGDDAVVGSGRVARGCGLFFCFANRARRKYLSSRAAHR